MHSCIALGLLNEKATVADLTDTALRSYLENKAKESKDLITVDSLHCIVKEELKMNMADTSAKSRMDSLFISYLSHLRRNNLSWIAECNPKVALMHVLRAIKPKTLRERLESDLNFSQYELRKDFRGLMKHAVRLSEAFELLE